MKNKSGSKVLSVYWFAILFIVAGAVAYMVILFYGAPYDVREIESNILTTQIANCLSQGGYLKEGILTESFKENFLEECDLNLEVEDSYGWNEGSEYYIEVGIHEFEESAVRGMGSAILEIVEGNPNLKTTLLLEKVKTERVVDRIVIHYTETLTLKAAEEEFNYKEDKSIHYIIDKDGFVVKGEVGEDETAYHAGCQPTRPKCEKSPDNCCVRGMNERSIGIELVNSGKESYPQEQTNVLAMLVAEIAERHDIPIDREHIIGHDEVDPGRKVDPGELFQWSEFIQNANSIFAPASSIFEKGFYVLDKTSGEEYMVNIFTLVGKEEKNEAVKK